MAALLLRCSEWKWVGEHAGAGTATGEGADELERVDLDALTADTSGERTPGGAGQQQLERLTVGLRPFGDVVGNEPAVVVGGDIHGTTGCGLEIDAMRPDVTREADVEEVPQPDPPDRRAERNRNVAQRGRRPPPTPDRFWSRGRELRDELPVRQVAALPDLQLVDAVDPVVRLDLTVHR